MKLEGSLFSPLKFSSLKYDMTCVVCFQKFIISCSSQYGVLRAIATRLSIRAAALVWCSYLIFRVALE